MGEDDRARDRDDWRHQPRGAPEQEPVGVAFRIAAIEETLKDHFNEVEAHKTYIDSVKNMIAEVVNLKSSLEVRLDQTLPDWHHRVTGIDKKHLVATDGLRAETSSILLFTPARLDELQ